MTIHLDGHKLGKGEAEPVVVVPVVRVVVVPVRHSAVPRVVVPATTTQHAVGAYDF